ncbi:Pc13g04540 [Penicillium rubens Wisconsin 54-1255]|uniref:Pc13g04540 protein n=1 Tax=Penicillium rubens (strain ATCC 28089 / DSM 1075 / NRRL 1951 / Wisconsin 54-1255) TaxID=500485 RepID=B6H2A7_PENRW|nr:Pc13g04540 [Penicillium rubens Wisconsin 54-1255]
MPPKGGITKREPPRRRKIALACESCRDKKVRCDGIKPICGPCARRSYTVDQCVYKLDNARSASNDEYLKILHNRIRELEETCAKGGVTVPPGPSQDGDYRAPGSQSHMGEDMDLDHLDAESRTSVAAEGLLGLGSTPVPSGPIPLSSTPTFQPPRFPAQRNIPEAERYRSPHVTHLSPESTQPRAGSIYPSPSLNSHGNVTAMGAISVAEDEPSTDSPREQQYYGNSSVASFMRLAGESMPLQSYMSALRDSKSESSRSQGPDTGIWRDLGHPSVDLRFDDFSLPPRSLADHLLECYWDRVHCLFPFFHRPSFEQAYENLWGSDKASKPELPQLNIGLGGAFDCGPNSIVFHCALNCIFAIGCYFSDIPPADREAAVYSFFLRAKRFVNLDLLDIGTIGVVQTLLIVSLLLQSTPYPNRCWNAIGLACRAGQGLGLHETTTHASNKPLETEIRRRTWHSCVIMDMIVSMTHGRPSMTSHISPLPLPAMGTDSEEADPCELSGQPCDHKLGYMTFYVSTIELYKILESILSEVYNAWQSRSNTTRTGSFSFCAFRLQFLTKERFIHLRLLLYRPMFTQLCSDERAGSSRRSDSQSSERNIIYSTVFSKCAASCVMAAIDLVSLVYKTYRTNVTDAWWYNGFYTSTAGFILIMSYSCHSIREQVDSQIVDESWRKCEEILAFMAIFSLSARNSLQFLQVTHQHITQNYSATCRPGDPSMVSTQLHQRGNQQPNRPDLSSQPTEPIADEHNLRHGPANMDINLFSTWDEMSLGQEEFGFLGRFDLPDLASWFADIPP